MEDFKQKIQKQIKLKNKAIKEFKKYFDIESAGILEIPKEGVNISKIEEFKEAKIKREKKKTPRKQQMNRPYFTEDFQKCEWLTKHGCTCQEDRKFLYEFKNSEQYKLLYGGDN